MPAVAASAVKQFPQRGQTRQPSDGPVHLPPVPRKSVLSLVLVLLVLAASCGGNMGGGRTGGTGASPAVQHVAIVILENQDYADIVSSSAMPYLNGLVQRGALATQFYANAHPSIGNYFMLTTGQLVNTDDNFEGTFSGDNVTTAIDAAGKTWRAYAESLPNIGYVDGDEYPYIKHHNPFAYFDNVRNDSTQRNHIVPLTQLSSDMSARMLPSYLFVVPNDLHNGHDCPSGGSNCLLSERLAALDAWLQANVGPVLADPDFAKNGVLVITFDESASDNTMGGGRIATVFAGGSVKSDFQSTTSYQFPSLLRFSLKVLGVTTYPGAAAEARDMDEFLQ